MPIRKFVKLESASGICLMAAAALAIILDNTPLAPWYDALLAVPLEIRIGELQVAKPLLLWINDGLMAVFFLLIGLEIKREVLEGELSTRDRAMLPTVAAIGGMAGPALIFWALNSGLDTVRGWAIPAATDIAFALGILSLLGKRVPLALKVFLTALAIIDDLGAILVIAVFYTENLSWTSLGMGVFFALGLFVLNRARVKTITPYAILGAALWVCVLKSGVHATLAGVVVAMAIPMRHEDTSPVKELEHTLHPWIAFLVMPVFAFANAGVSLSGLSLDALLAPLPLGIALGLFVGKQVGVLGCVALAVRLGLTQRPSELSWKQLHGAALLSGVGFTMSLFIGTLAFEDTALATSVRLGVLSGSLLSGICGYLVLYWALPRPATQREPNEVIASQTKSPLGVS